MPFINGRYYINPTFGRAIELARMSEEEQLAAESQHEPAHKGRHGISGLPLPQASWDLQQARFAMAHVIQNRAASRIAGGLASDEIKKPGEVKAIRTMGSKAYDAHGESVYAAHRAGKQPDPTNGAKHFYLEYGQGPPG